MNWKFEQLMFDTLPFIVALVADVYYFSDWRPYGETLLLGGITNGCRMNVYYQLQERGEIKWIGIFRDDSYSGNTFYTESNNILWYNSDSANAQFNGDSSGQYPHSYHWLAVWI